MKPPPFVLSIAGSDSSACAGIQMDNRAIEACGAHPLNVLTAITVQTPDGVIASEVVSTVSFVQQLEGVLKSFPVAAMKSGMLGSAAIVAALAEVLEKYPQIPYVLDPVCQSTSGTALLDTEGISQIRQRLLLRAQLVTPNLDELRLLVQADDYNANTPREVIAGAIAQQYGCAVLLKGGHGESIESTDELYFPNGKREAFSAPRIQSRNTRGTGCALSALIAARLAHGDAMEIAVATAKQRLSEGLVQQAKVSWLGAGPAFGG
ncbi:MAG: hydroxymethylpyrimidine/phosphomethylpyrimidine kinase [Puniceicoccaceae bacterium]|nr:MAG: hydroxymethylpyrimidine/phosphomethylpyrimidine kinase [Puniceicoccaceae bacterium]